MQGHARIHIFDFILSKSRVLQELLSTWSVYSIDLYIVCQRRLHSMTPKEILVDKGNNKITELRTILQRESQNS